jgi:hypothetical protein
VDASELIGKSFLEKKDARATGVEGKTRPCLSLD